MDLSVTIATIATVGLIFLAAVATWRFRQCRLREAPLTEEDCQQIFGFLNIGRFAWGVDLVIYWDRQALRLHDARPGREGVVEAETDLYGPGYYAVPYDVWLSRVEGEEEREWAMAVATESKSAGVPYVLATRIRCRNGKVRHLLAVGRWEGDEMRGIVLDITKGVSPLLRTVNQEQASKMLARLLQANVEAARLHGELARLRAERDAERDAGLTPDSNG